PEPEPAADEIINTEACDGFYQTSIYKCFSRSPLYVLQQLLVVSLKVGLEFLLPANSLGVVEYQFHELVLPSPESITPRRKQKGMNENDYKVSIINFNANNKVASWKHYRLPLLVAAAPSRRVIRIHSRSLDNRNPRAGPGGGDALEQRIQFFGKADMGGEHRISSQKKKTGVIAPKRFVQRLKKQNDAHEFLNYLLNELDDILEKEAKTDNETSSSPGKISNGPKLLQANGVHKEPTVTWVHKIFQVTISSFWLHYYTRVKLNRVPKPNQIIKYDIFFSKHLSRIKC
ncbi:hypothetical protein HID58_073151, partial [Brassica napus]